MRWSEGKLRRGHNVELGFLSQHAEEIDRSGTVLEAAQRATGLTPGKARALLGRFLFSGADAEKEVVVLSGGELRRLSLAILVASGANLLILDEPTNHLDIESREALEDALRGFDGSLLLVSHDRALLDAVGTRTIAMEDGSLRSYEGGWADYVRVREERKAAAAPPQPAKRNGTPPPRSGREARGIEEHQAQDRDPGTRHRTGGGGARERRGRAGRSHGVGDARAVGAVDRASSRGQARGRVSL